MATTTIRSIQKAYDNEMEIHNDKNYILLGGNVIPGTNDGSLFPYIYIIYDVLPSDTTPLFLINKIPGKLNNGVEIYATTQTIPERLQKLYNDILNYETPSGQSNGKGFFDNITSAFKIPFRIGGKKSKKRKSRKNKKSKRKTNKK